MNLLLLLLWLHLLQKRVGLIEDCQNRNQELQSMLERTFSGWNSCYSTIKFDCIAECARNCLELSFEYVMSIAALKAGIGTDWPFETFPEYMECLDRLPKGINYATYVGHSALRTWSMETAHLTSRWPAKPSLRAWKG